ncbi:MAG: PorT family protein [Acidobacteria bacterium]|nr:PorT family protein [Acidobacteriota bacterium]
MRALFLFLIGAASAFSAPFTIGVKAGVPLTDFFSTVQSPNFGFNSSTKRYIIGPTAQLNLPLGFAVEFDALYRRFNYNSTSTLPDLASQTSGNAWEFPLLLKYRFPGVVIRPFVDAGVAWDTLSGLKQSFSNAISTGNPAQLRNSTTTGIVVGGGLDVHAIVLHIAPEVRFTHWGSEHFRDAVNNLIHSNQNQAEFLLGITF